MKTVASKKLPAVGDINSFDHMVSRDFGYKNGITLSVVRRDREIDLAEMARLLNLDKADALKYLQSHSHPMDILDRVRFSGQGFLPAINAQVPKDREPDPANQTWAFNKLERLKANICGYLEISTKQRFAEDLLPKIGDPRVRLLCGEFYRLLHHIWGLKGQRLGLFADPET